MKINIAVIAIAVVAVLGFVYFIIRRNHLDRKDLERELNEKETTPDAHSKNKV